MKMPRTNTSIKGNKRQKNANKNNWSKGLFDAGNSLWGGEFDIGDVRHSPLEPLMKCFTEDLFEAIANETNVYSMTTTGSSMTSPEPPKRSKIAVRPVEDVQYDLVEHWPESVDGKPQRCKLEQCNGRSRVCCQKCNVHLCLVKD